jgi:hypothetical protein
MIKKTRQRAAPAQWQIEDAARLKVLFFERKRLEGLTEAQFAVDFFDGASQGAVNHYLTGRQPLNLDALIRFSKGLGCLASEISPRLSERLTDALHSGVLERAASYSPEVAAIASLAEALDAEGKKAVRQIAQNEKRNFDLRQQMAEMVKNLRNTA